MKFHNRSCWYLLGAELQFLFPHLPILILLYDCSIFLFRGNPAPALKINVHACTLSFMKSNSNHMVCKFNWKNKSFAKHVLMPLSLSCFRDHVCVSFISTLALWCTILISSMTELVTQFTLVWNQVKLMNEIWVFATPTTGGESESHSQLGVWLAMQSKKLIKWQLVTENELVHS